MTEAEIIAAIRRGIREPSARKVSDTIISQVILRAVVTGLGIKIRKFAPLTLETRKSLSSNTNVFAFPSDCDEVLRVWDLDTNAKSITDATNASPIVITSTAHGFSDDDIVFIHDVLDNTAANGTWKVDNKTDDTFELYDSTGNADCTSGGKVFKETADFTKLERRPESESTLEDETRWFLRNQTIVVDDVDFTNDILISYYKTISAITDIQAKWHPGLVAYGVLELIKLPDKPDAPGFDDLKQSLRFHSEIWKMVNEDILHGSGQSVERATSSPKRKHI